jgi:tryptophan-rich sensory protein
MAPSVHAHTRLGNSMKALHIIIGIVSAAVFLVIITVGTTQMGEITYNHPDWTPPRRFAPAWAQLLWVFILALACFGLGWSVRR